MPLPPQGDAAEGLGDDYSEEPFTASEMSTEPVGVPTPPEEPAEAEGVDGYLPYDLAQVRPTVHDPLTDEEGTLKTVLRDEEGNPLPEFDPQYREDFTGLTFLGALSKKFEWLGHRFVIRTITVDEALQVALLTKAYADTIGNGLAYRTAMAAMAVQSVDGKDLPIPVGVEPESFAYASQRFDYAKARWFQFTIDAIYNEYLELEFKTRQVLDAMGKASGPTGSTSG